nr:hypothetical protein [uncultured Desulfobulbus sp.]
MKNDKDSILYKILTKMLKREIKKKLEQISKNCKREIKYHHHTIDGLANKLSYVILYSIENPKYVNNFFDGYHIYSSDLIILKNNKLYKNIIFFEKSPNSTYHKNNGKCSEKNGYSHWYRYSDFTINCFNIALYLTKRQILYNRTYKVHEKYHQNKIKSVFNKTDETNNTNGLCKINKRIFLYLYSQFRKGICNDFIKILKKSLFCDDEYVYFDNNAISSSLDGFGREYTTIGNLSKDFRKFILKGYTEIDIDCAIQSILVNLYYYNTLKPWIKVDFKELKNDYPSHHKMMADKNRFRDSVCFKFKCELPMAKQIITSISYSPNRRIIYEYCEKRKYPIVMENGTRYFDFPKKRILECRKLIDPLVEETKKLREKVLEKFYYQNNDFNTGIKIGNIFIKNFKKLIDEDIETDNIIKRQKIKGYGKGKSLEDRILFRIYQLVECQIRNKMIQFLESKNINEHYQLHDCVIFKGDVEVKELMRFIYEELRMIILFSKKVY